MKKVLLAVAALLLSANAWAAEVKMTFSGSVPQEDQEMLVQAVGEDLAAELVDLVKDGYEVSVAFDYDGSVGIRADHETRNCEVTIKEKTNGGGGGRVDLGKGRVGGAEVKGSGGSEREITVKGPCKEVRDIVRDIRNGKP